MGFTRHLCVHNRHPHQRVQGQRPPSSGHLQQVPDPHPAGGQPGRLRVLAHHRASLAQEQTPQRGLELRGRRPQPQLVVPGDKYKDLLDLISIL